MLGFVSFKGNHDSDQQAKAEKDQNKLSDKLIRIEEMFAEAMKSRHFFDLGEVYSRITSLQNKLDKNESFITYLLLKDKSFAFKYNELQQFRGDITDLETQQFAYEIQSKANADSKSKIWEASKNHQKKIVDLEEKHKVTSTLFSISNLALQSYIICFKLTPKVSTCKSLCRH